MANSPHISSYPSLIRCAQCLRHLSLLTLLILASVSVMAQKGKGGGGAGAGGAGAPPGSSGPASASGTQQTGYVYRLPWRYHIQYESVKSREADSLVHNGKPTANFNTYTKRVLYKHLAQGVRETVEIHQDHDKV